MTEPTTRLQDTELGGEPAPIRLCLASYLVVEARRLVTVAVAEAESDRTSHPPVGALVELDTIAGELARAEARLHRLLGARSP